VNFWDFVLRLDGKWGPSLLVPTGVLISSQFHMYRAFFAMNFEFALLILGARVCDDCVTLWSDSNPLSLVLNPTESRVFSNRSFSRSRKTPFLLGNSSIPPKPWSDSSILLVGMFTRSLWSCLQNLVRFWLDLILQSPSFPKNAGWKIVSGHGQSFSCHRLDLCLWYVSSVQPVSRFFTH